MDAARRKWGAARRERDFRSVSADNAHLILTRRRVLARITAVDFADRETVKCTARDVEIAMRISRRTKCGGMRESTVMRLTSIEDPFIIAITAYPLRLRVTIMRRCGNLV